MITCNNMIQSTAKKKGAIREIVTCHVYALANGLVGMGLIPGLIRSFEETFVLSHTWMGAILATGAVLYSVLVIVFGLIADHRGYRFLLIVSTALIAVSAALLWQSPVKLIAVVALLIFYANYANESLINSLTFGLYGEKSAKGMNLLHGIHSGGRMLAPLLITLMIAVTGTWRTVFLVSMVVNLLLLVPLSVMRKSPVAGSFEGTSLKESLLILRLPPVLLGVMAFVFLVGCEMTLISWVANYLETETDLSREQALIGLTAMMAGFTGIRLVLGLIHFEFTAGLVLLALAVIGAGYVGLTVASNPVLIYGICFLLGVSMGPNWPLTANLLFRVLPGGRGLLAGLFFLGGMIGVMVFNGVTGVLGDMFSLRIALGIAPVSYAVFAAILIFFLRKRKSP